MRNMVVVLALGGLALGCTADGSARANPSQARPATADGWRGPAVPASFREVVERAVPAVVSVTSTQIVEQGGIDLFDDPFFRRFLGGLPSGQGRGRRQELRGLGSGVLVGNGLILTNAHVVEGAQQLEVTTFDGRELQVKVAGIDPESDLAVLRVSGDTTGLRWLELGDSSDLHLGDIVLAIGNPFGIGETVTMGIVSATGRAEMGITDYEDFIQTDAAINPGNSGGALIDARGRLVGIPTAIVSRAGGSLGIGFAIPTDMALPVMKSLLASGRVRRGWLGVEAQDISADLARALGVAGRDGVVVTSVTPGSPAARAGLRRGDVLRSIDHVRIRAPGALRNRLAAAGAGTSVHLEVVRDRPIALDVELAELPSAPRQAPPAPAAAATRDTGIVTAPLDQEVRDALEVPDSIEHGLVVIEVEPGSPMARAGLRIGDLVLELDRQPIDGASRLREQWSRRKAIALLYVWRDGHYLYLTVRR